VSILVLVHGTRLTTQRTPATATQPRARRLAAGPTAAHAVTKRLVHHATDHGVRETDGYLLDAATPLFATRDMQHAVDLLLTHGAREFMASRHAADAGRVR
jgi:hypothetical protein